jgi:hypothetical protein
MITTFDLPDRALVDLPPKASNWRTTFHPIGSLRPQYSPALHGPLDVPASLCPGPSIPWPLRCASATSRVFCHNRSRGIKFIIGIQQYKGCRKKSPTAANCGPARVLLTACPTPVLYPLQTSSFALAMSFPAPGAPRDGRVRLAAPIPSTGPPREGRVRALFPCFSAS